MEPNPTSASSATSVLLVEDELLWQEGIKTLLSLDNRFRLVAISDTYEEALTLYDEHQPDIVLLDWKIAGERDGLEVGKALEKKGHAPSHMIVVSGSLQEFIPENPYHYVAKPQIASQLIATLEKITKC